MDLKKLVSQLNSLERKIIPYLEKHSNFNDLVKVSGMQDVQVVRALQGLEDKQALKINTSEIKIVKVTDKAKNYHELPERIVLNHLHNNFVSLSELKNKTKLDEAEINVSIGLLKKFNAIEIKKEKELMIKLINNVKKTHEEELFSILKNKEHKLNSLDNNVVENLKRRGLVTVETSKEMSISLTELGKHLTKQKIENNLIEVLNSDVIKNYDSKQFRPYDVKVNVPKVYGGRLHPLQESVNQIRRIFMDMGFKEMKGPLIETSFWCFDSMWIPQNHPAREVQDTFFLKEKGKLPEKLKSKVAIAHENGGKTGSKGYGYKWNEDVAKQLLLRTHTTSTTFRYFGEKNIKAPAKYFYIGRIFRNEAIDATHLPEFHQSEGFIMDEGLTLRDLMGYIKEFYSKMGIHKIKFKPTYNPYTEPSMEAIGYNEQLGKWVELINSGIFRPEALEPFGINVPVIAWGLGVERLAMMIHQQKDIRNMLSASGDLNSFRNSKVIKKW